MFSTHEAKRKGRPSGEGDDESRQAAHAGTWRRASQAAETAGAKAPRPEGTGVANTELQKKRVGNKIEGWEQNLRASWALATVRGRPGLGPEELEGETTTLKSSPPVSTCTLNGPVEWGRGLVSEYFAGLIWSDNRVSHPLLLDNSLLCVGGQGRLCALWGV